MAGFSLADLADIVAARRSASAEQSYTKSLIDRGAAHCARKLGEEAIETVIAATGEDKAAIAAESADLLYHLLVMLEACAVPLDDVMAELQRRTAQSGHAEKVARG